MKGCRRAQEARRNLPSQKNEAILCPQTSWISESERNRQLSFREDLMPEARFLGIVVLGSPMNSGNGRLLALCTSTVDLCLNAKRLLLFVALCSIM
jgi:hypothetical protein